MAMMTLADGVSVIRETIFENRFMHVPELARMGADIVIQGSEARVTGVEASTGAQVMATDLRASISLNIAGLAARGETVVNRVYHLDRGFERLEQKLGARGRQHPPHLAPADEEEDGGVSMDAQAGRPVRPEACWPRTPTIWRSSPAALQDAVAMIGDIAFEAGRRES